MLSGGAGRVHSVRQHLSSGGPGLWDETRLFLLPQHTTALRPSRRGLKMQHHLCLFILHGDFPRQLQLWLIHSPPGALQKPALPQTFVSSSRAPGWRWAGHISSRFLFWGKGKK